MNKAELAKALIEALEFEFEPRAYSGRGMYGKQCVAVVGDPFEIGLAIGDIEDSGLRLQLRSISQCQDSMGMETVVYWPSLEWPNDKEESA